MIHVGPEAKQDHRNQHPKAIEAAAGHVKKVGACLKVYDSLEEGWWCGNAAVKRECVEYVSWCSSTAPVQVALLCGLRLRQRHTLLRFLTFLLFFLQSHV